MCLHDTLGVTGSSPVPPTLDNSTPIRDLSDPALRKAERPRLSFCLTETKIPKSCHAPRAGHDHLSQKVASTSHRAARIVGKRFYLGDWKSRESNDRYPPYSPQNPPRAGHRPEGAKEAGR